MGVQGTEVTWKGFTTDPGEPAGQLGVDGVDPSNDIVAVTKFASMAKIIGLGADAGFEDLTGSDI